MNFKKLLITLIILYVPSFIFADDSLKLLSLNIEQLMNVQVETANRYKEDFIKSASAVYIITSEDIKRSGYNTLPEVLKMVPGVDVVRADSNKWGVTVRGFNGVFSNKLMVLVDGVNIYNHLFSGVFWDIQSIPLEMIDRIEVIRGASGTMWGANAVNGVINIFTKKTSDVGIFNFSGAYGDNTDDTLNILHGNKINDNLYYAIDVNYQDYYKATYKNLREEPTYLKGILKVNYDIFYIIIDR